ncbi:hypothetical protein GCM10011316_31600 [Roseibium aquae]|uniref:Uncharacterized protein n=1 Tax=Roseibium aquae TaxID=1323746 RepID=A0A916X3B0_9HYPH|nr:hypothetical protein [Roseibium aquae]GGB57192.1 hypothetical protein GCM10011316_31600 [Roseibium aquae]
MISLREAVWSLKGSWLLLQNRPEGLSWFDLSLGGFWRSFGAILFILPLFWVSSLAEQKLILMESDMTAEGLAATNFWVSRFLALGLDWIALPLLLAALAGPIGISQGYAPFIAVRNWTSLLIAAPYALIGLFYLSGMISSGFTVLFWMTILIAALWYRFVVARITLRCGVGLAIGIVVLDFLLSLFIQEMSGRLLG